MFKTLDCIALRTVRYSDRNSILTAYTRQSGRMSLLIPAGNGKTASRLRALLMPMGRFECVADIRPGREIHPIRDVRPVKFPPIGDPLRSTLALFIADILSGLLKEQMADPLLFDFLDYTLSLLGTGVRNCDSPQMPRILKSAELQNFHLCFLLKLSRFLGIEPDWPTFSPGSVLDYSDGIFRKIPPPHRHFLPPGESEAARQLSRMNFRNLGRFRLNRFERNTILDRILLYYQTHYPSATPPGSVEILRMMAD